MEIFGVLAVVLGSAALGGVVAKALKQPVILGYVLAGAVLTAVGGRWVDWGHAKQTVELLGQLGVTLLLFLAGMELPVAELKKIGNVALVAAIVPMMGTGLVGYLAVMALGWTQTTAIYAGLAMIFGSTIMVVKLLAEKRDLQSLYGKIAVGILLVQDFVAMGILVMLAGVSGSGSTFGLMSIVGVLAKGLLLAGVAVWMAGGVVAPALRFLGRSTELLFISGVAWCLAVAAVVGSKWVGFSYEIGGLVAGLAIAGSVEQEQIISRVRPLRDFFLTWFFVALGVNLSVYSVLTYGWQIVVLSLVILVVNPCLVLWVLCTLGYRKRMAFFVAVTLTQMSEFGLILLAKVLDLGLIDGQIISVLTVVTMVTMTVSSYFIWHVDKLYKYVGKKMWVWERKRTLETKEADVWSDHIVLFGHNRTGQVLRPILEGLGKKVLVIDFNPQIVDKLNKTGISVMYGDMSDVEFLEELGLDKANAVISTVPDVSDSLQLLSVIAHHKHKPTVVVTAVDEVDAARLYKKGADYVLIPHTVGGEYLGELVKSFDIPGFEELGRKHRSSLVG